MLLLVIEADFDKGCQFLQRGLGRILEKSHHGRVDMPAIGCDVFDAGAGQQTARVAGVPGTGADIVGIEEIGVVRVKRLVAFAMFAKQELLEEPGGVRPVPFRRARIRHRLYDLIFRAKGRGAPFGLAADGQVGFHQILGQRAGIGEK